MYHIVSLPLIARTKLSKDQQKMAYKYFDTYGYKVFNPTNINSIKDKFDKLSMFCTFLYLVFKLLLLNEHETGIKLYQKDHPEFKSKMAIPKIQSPVINEILSEVKYCESKNINNIYTLLTDLYTYRDNSHVFGGSHGSGPSGMTSTREEEDITTEPLSETKEIKNENRRKNIRPDEDYVSNDKNNTVLILLDPLNYTYLGHIYIWPSLEYNNTADVVGIRTSIVNIFCKKEKEIGKKLITACIIWANKNNFKLLRVQQPLDVMINILQKLRFWKSRNTDYWTLVKPSFDSITDLSFDFINYNCDFPWFDKEIELSETELEFLISKFKKEIYEYNKHELSPNESRLIKKYLKSRNKWLPYYYWNPTSEQILNRLSEKKLIDYYNIPIEYSKILKKYQ